jgi:colanic acid biosynthesis glycosyl transferase WcaI
VTWRARRHSETLLIARTILLISQTFPPDAAAVGQHFGDVAREFARRGYSVLVLASARGYDDPTVVYPLRERTTEGVEVRRMRLSSLGKQSITRRLAASVAFMVQALVVALSMRALAGVVVSTSPPLVGVIGAIVGRMRRVPVTYWVMDLNPDQLIALDKLSPHGVLARSLQLLNRAILRSSALVVALDEFMAKRVARLGARPQTLRIIPPWPPSERLQPPQRVRNPFRIGHGIADELVVMYSGNHTPTNPLTTLLEAAARLRNDSRLRFVFVGGGAGKSEVDRFRDEYALPNVLSLPYQPLSALSDSLGAADIHVVSLGDRMTGIVHPSKVYGAMAVGRPILYLGPRPSHVSLLIEAFGIGWHVSHGDLEGAVRTLRAIADTSAADRQAMGDRARAAIEREYSPATLCARLCDAIEQTMLPPGAARICG